MKRSLHLIQRWAGLLFLVLSQTYAVHAQVTTSAVRGRVVDQNKEALPGVPVRAVHVPSGTEYVTVSQTNGSFIMTGMRVGGPYKISASFIGYEASQISDLYLSLGVTSDISFMLKEQSTTLEEVVITGNTDPIMSSNRTGAATSVNRASISTLPTITRRIGDFTRLTPQSRGNSFVGTDDRLNNITVDGSYFNNSFGLAGQPGDRTGVSPISLDAIEQIQVNIAPYDVRQGNFVGAGVNTVTRSGTNQLQGSAYYLFRNESLVGTRAAENVLSVGKFNYKQAGFTLGGPLVKNKLFFFASYEQENLTEPATTFRANRGGEAVTGNVTRVLASDLDSLSKYLRTKFNYETGPYQGYDNQTGANKFLVKLDYNISNKSKLSFRYNHLDSDTDVLLSNSSSLGFGNRRSNTNGLNFLNSNYQIIENIRSFIAEWNTTFGNNMSNSLIAGYTFQDESRRSRGGVFPMVDILKEGTVYTTFGFEPFTPNNELRYSTFQLQNNFNIYKNNHTITLGVSAERYESENVFFPGSQSAYVYNSLEDFYADAEGFLADPNRMASPVSLRRFQVRWSNIPGQEKPIQPLEVFFGGIYGQDVWTVNNKLNITAGLRVEVPFFGNTALKNSEVDTLNFRDEDGNTVRYSTDKLPDPNILFSPRLGFNFDVDGTRRTQVRGGTGIFTGRPAYVWISNQVGNNGILTGFERLDNTTTRPFNPDPDTYKPETVNGTPASQYELALTDPSFRFPQVWRSNIAIDQKLPLGLVATVELLYNRELNGIYYINANLPAPSGNFTGADDRERWTAGNKIVSKIDNAIVLKNQNVGSGYNFAASIERIANDGFYFKAGYSYGVAQNTVDAGSVAFGSWNNNQHAGNPNNPGLGFGNNMLGHRAFGAMSYKVQYEKGRGATTFSLFFDAFSQGVASYVFSGDLNGDGGTANDLIYIHRDKSEMNFQEYSASGKTFTVDQQRDAWEKFIEQDDYLSKNRGSYAKRGGILLPMVQRLDLGVAHDFYINIGKKRNAFQVRMDIINFTNMINPRWGVGDRLTTTTPLVVASTPADAEGKTLYRLQQFGGNLISESYQKAANIADVYRIQLGIRYTFN
ncbi:MAG: TonB-dependent receptor [Saprospiraceae bacterium]|nr:TonB-dependent receptor [Saprospiraceae bacterium]